MFDIWSVATDSVVTDKSNELSWITLERLGLVSSAMGAGGTVVSAYLFPARRRRTT